MSRLVVRKTYKLFIGGQFPRSESGRTTRVVDARGEFVANVARASRKDLRDAVRAARKAQVGWAARSAFNRAQILYRLAEMLETRRSVFAPLLGEAGDDEVSASVDRLVWYAGWADKITQTFGAVNPVAAPFFNFSTPAPVGNVVAFAPAAAPLLGLVSVIAPVIVLGNAVTVVVDSAVPQVALELAEALATSDLPAGVVNILTGPREELAGHAATHVDVDAVASAGATDDERAVIDAGAADSVKRVHFLDPPAGADWTSSRAQSPYWILAFSETRTAWHPIGT